MPAPSDISKLTADSPLPYEDRRSIGKKLRDRVSRDAHSGWKPPLDRRNPIRMLRISSRGRIRQLIPLRYGRMVHSPFTFLRGTANIMAADLATTPTTWIRVQACGDAHILNFGGYATPERNLVFGLNDFDETLPAPWEWDVKRLAASVFVAGREIGLSDQDCKDLVCSTVRTYREKVAQYSEMNRLEVWYSRIEASTLLEITQGSKHHKGVSKQVRKAYMRSSASIFPKLTDVVSGQRRIIDNPPLIYHLPEHSLLEAELVTEIEHYRQSVRDDLHVLLDSYSLVDLAIKVVGIGSVGTRCSIALLMAAENDPLFLQIKEARASVLEPFAGRSQYQNHGQRVVAGQRLLQSASDIFLGWTHSNQGHDFYIRQLKDMKVSVNVQELSRSSYKSYCQLCGWALARAHSRAGDPAIISGYLGRSEVFDLAIAAFAKDYADQTEQDHAAMQAAIKAGIIQTTTEVGAS